MNLDNTVQMTLFNEVHYDSKCAYCGKGFNKTHNHQLYCGPNCKKFARLEQKARYQRKRRRLMNHKELISNENKYLGTNFLSKHRRTDFHEEYIQINKEMRRLKLR